MRASAIVNAQSALNSGSSSRQAGLWQVARPALAVVVAVFGCSTPRVHVGEESGGTSQIQHDGGSSGGTHQSSSTGVVGDAGGGAHSGAQTDTDASLAGSPGSGGGVPAAVGGTLQTINPSGSRTSAGGASNQSSGSSSAEAGTLATGGVPTSRATWQLGGTAAIGGGGGASTKSPSGGSRASGGVTFSTGASTYASGGIAPGSGGNSYTSSAGGITSSGGGDAGFAASGASFSFFAFGDTHLGQGGAASENFNTALAQMNLIDPNTLAAFSNGDLVDDATSGNWALFEKAIQSSMYRKDVNDFDGPPRFLGVLGNHDLGIPFTRADWLTQWNQHLPNQVSLGHNGADGVYYAVTLRSALVIALDSQHPSTAQAEWLETLLTGEQAVNSKVKIALFHQPVYPCSSAHSPYEDGLAWVDLFEKYGVRLVLVSHLHDYERTCPMRAGRCSPDGGVTYVNLSPVGATNYRNTDRTVGEVDGMSADGRPRTDRYDCSGSEKILDFSKSGTNGFCRIQVDGCRVTGACFLVGPGSSLPFDSWQVDMCDH